MQAHPAPDSDAGLAKRPAPEEVFEHWVRARARDPREPLSTHSAAKYRSVWRAWLRFLASQRPTRRWYGARADDVSRFVESLSPRRSTTHAPSPVSRRRYWRVLERIYDHASACGWCRTNPAHTAPDIPATESCDAVVLPPHFLALLQRWAQGQGEEPDAQRARTPATAGALEPPWQHARDRALLALALDTAATTAELAALRLDQLSDYPAHRTALVRLDGARAAQRRTLELSPWAARVVQHWCAQRAALPGMTARTTAGTAASVPWLFVSRKGLRPLTAKSVFVALRAHVARLEDTTATRIAHRGANLVRSSVLAQWLREGASESDVLARAGLDQPQALRRLAHVREHAQQPEWQHARKSPRTADSPRQ